jgi:tetratricopeptide (TPR) repeat protein
MAGRRESLYLLCASIFSMFLPAPRGDFHDFNATSASVCAPHFTMRGLVLDASSRCGKMFYPSAMRSVCILIFASVLQAVAGQASGQAPTVNVDELLSSGIAAQQRHDYATAIADYRKLLAAQPGMAEARANLGAALADAGQYDAAIEEDTHALATAPDKIAVRQNLALAYYKKGDMEHAREQFEMVHAARPLDISAAVLLGYVYIKEGKEAESIALLTPLETGHENNMDLEFVLASGMIQSGKIAEGLPRMEKVARATHSADAYVIAGSTRLQRREFHEARADLDAAVTLDPSIPGLETMAGQARDALGDTEAALPAFQAALRENPRDFTANLYLGTMRMKQRDFASARPMLELAVELQPASAQARLELAKLNGMTGNYAEAAKMLEGLEKGDPNWLDPHVELATLYYKLHRPEDGQRERAIVDQIEARQQKAGPNNK